MYTLPDPDWWKLMSNLAEFEIAQHLPRKQTKIILFRERATWLKMFYILPSAVVTAFIYYHCVCHS
jgi:hypothetical protein